uniref:CPSF_A domain-containing protein n=1 Tax=Steinernema glaseri TaxID=37863 RepID=A0A1I7XX38_9BILA
MPRFYSSSAGKTVGTVRGVHEYQFDNPQLIQVASISSDQTTYIYKTMKPLSNGSVIEHQQEELFVLIAPGKVILPSKQVASGCESARNQSLSPQGVVNRVFLSLYASCSFHDAMHQRFIPHRIGAQLLVTKRQDTGPFVVKLLMITCIDLLIRSLKLAANMAVKPTLKADYCKGVSWQAKLFFQVQFTRAHLVYLLWY